MKAGFQHFTGVRSSSRTSAAVMLLCALGAAPSARGQGQFFPIPGASSEPGTNPAFCGISGTTGYSSVRVSGDGRVAATVVFRPGFVDGYVERRAARWTEATGTVAITPYLDGLYPVTGISSNGQVVYGDTWSWTASGGFEDLNQQFQTLSTFGINIFGCSDDGQTVTGARARSGIPTDVELFRWRINDGPLTILPEVPELPQGYFLFNTISGDGRIVGGTAQGPADTYLLAGVVVNEAGAMAVTEVGSQNQVTDLSFDGSIAVGAVTISGQLRAFRWTAESGTAEIDSDFAPSGSTYPRAVSADGSVVVGEYLTSSANGILRAAIWIDGVGIDLRSYLLGNFNLEILNEWTLLVATDVSSDGRTIVGQGLNPEGCEQAFLVRLSPPEPIGCGPADVAGGGVFGLSPDGVVDGTDFIAFINSFSVGDPAIDALADIAGGGPGNDQPDGIIDGTDFVAFINAFGAGC